MSWSLEVGEPEQGFEPVDTSGRAEYLVGAYWINGADLTDEQAEEAEGAIREAAFSGRPEPVVRRARLPVTPPAPTTGDCPDCGPACREAARLAAARTVALVHAARLWANVTLDDLTEAAGVTLDDVAEAKRRIRRGE